MEKVLRLTDNHTLAKLDHEKFVKPFLEALNGGDAINWLSDEVEQTQKICEARASKGLMGFGASVCKLTRTHEGIFFSAFFRVQTFSFGNQFGKVFYSIKDRQY